MTLGSTAPATIGPLASKPTADIYAVALNQLEKRVGQTINREEFDRFCSASRLCSHGAALDALNAANAGHSNAHPTLRKFINNIGRLCAPLERFKSALDTFVQVAAPACLIWGSIKVILTVTQELREVPELINKTFDDLIDSLPIYEQYRLALTKNATCPLKEPLARIYEEYIYFCILATREAKKHSFMIVLRATISSKERSTLEQPVKVIRVQSKLVSQIAISLTYMGVEGLQKTMEIVVQNAKLQQHANSLRQPKSQYSHIPGLLSAKFVGRDDEIAWLRDNLLSTNNTHTKRRVCLYGMTGIGKTQLMLKYQEKYQSDYRSQLFLTAGSPVKLVDSLEQVLDVLALPERDEPGIAVKTSAFRAWLDTHEHWLLLIDNVGEDEHDIILNMLPSSPSGHVILTSQLRGVSEKITGRLQLCLEVKEPPLADSVEMFLEACEITRITENRNLAQRIVQDVGYLPHAVIQCASYIRENGIDLHEYLVRYQKAPDQVLEWQDHYSTKRIAISKHFVIIFQDLDERHHEAMLMLRLFSLFEPEAIPILDNWYRDDISLDEVQKATLATTVKAPSLMSRLLHLACCISSRSSKLESQLLDTLDRNEKSTEIIGVVKDTTVLYKAIAKLVDLSLIRRVGQRQLLWLHDLTRYTIKQTIPGPQQLSLLRTALYIIYHTYPQGDITLKERLLVDAYMMQAIKLIEDAKAFTISKWEYAPLMALCAQSMCNRGLFSRALDWFNISLPEYEKNLGRSHKRTAAVLHNMACAHQEAGELGLAESKYKMAWTIRKQILAENSLETLNTMNKLAACIERQGRLKEGETIFAKTYEGSKKTLGSSSSVTIAAAHNLALCYNNQGRLVQAEALYREALQSSEATVGSEDFGTLKTLGNLAVTVDQSGHLTEAEPLYDRALAAYTKLCGHDDMLTLRVRSNVSGLYRQQGRYGDAEAMIRDAMNSFLTIFGPRHFHTAVAFYDLGEILQEKGDLDEAKRIFTLALKMMEFETSQHPLTFRVIDAYGIICCETGDLAQADEYSVSAYQKNKELLGEDDPFTLVAAESRAEFLHIDRRHQEAFDTYNKCLHGFRTLLPIGHPHTLMVLNNLGRLSWVTHTAEALQYFKEAHDGFMALLGPSHHCTLTVLMNIARTQLLNKEFDTAQTSLEIVREGLRAKLGNLHPRGGVPVFHLGMLHACRRNAASMEQARNLFQDASDCFLKAFGSQHPNYLLSNCMLIRVLRELGEYDDANAYQSVLETQLNMGKAGKFITLANDDLTYYELASMDVDHFDWAAVVSLPFGETVRMRWGRKNVWREPVLAVLES